MTPAVHRHPPVILVVDDEPDNLNVLDGILQREQWIVRTFLRSDRALASAREEPPDLILLDILMPHMDGFEFCRRLKADSRHASIPVIFLTALTDTEDKLKAFGTGAADYITKPFAAEEVLARSRTHLRLKQHQDHLEDLVRQRCIELAEAHRRLRIWDDAKTQWLNTLSHEMRTPLTGLCGVVELLLGNTPPSDERDSLTHYYNVSRNRLEKLVDDALLLASLNTAMADFHGESLPLADALEPALRTAAVASGNLVLDPGWRAAATVRVAGVPGLLRRACSDLLSTALACVNDRQTVSLAVEVASSHVVIRLSTDGKSIPTDELEVFFEIGGQKTLFRPDGDFGLGATLARRIFQLFNGTLTVRNGWPQGLVLEASLPIAGVQPQENTP